MYITETVITAEEEKHIAAVQKAMEERGMLDHTIVHGVFVGPARSGKNSLMERLLGRMPSYVSPSTGVAESVVQVKVIQKSATFAANVEKLIWSEMDNDDEAIKLMLISTESQSKVQIPIEDAVETIDAETRHSDTTISNTAPDYSQSELAIDPESSEYWYEAHSSFPDDQPAVEFTSFQQCPQLPDSYVSPIEIFVKALKKKGKECLEILQQHFCKNWSLYLTNTGGQMEFQEVLPLLVSGPSMFFFTFRLDRDLNKSYSIEYDLSDGTSAKPYTSTLTTLEGILQTLASVSAMGMFTYQGLQRRTVALRPKVFLVGTHKDKLDSKKASKHIAKIDKQLQKVLRSMSHYKDLVEFASPTQLIFTVNNFSESDSDFQNIRSAFERVVVRDEFRMTSPSHWLLFSLALRRLTSDVISYDACLGIARECALADNEVDEALHFIHSKMGLIRYFPHDDVKNFVVVHPQHLFDKVTELIVNTFTFEKAGKQKMDEFNERGIFSLVEFENIYSRSNSDIKAFQFLKLLEKLRIAAPFHLKRNVMYFFPCVLAHVLTFKVSMFHKMSQKWKVARIPQLLVIFDCGYCPKGLPGALISYLMANEMESSFTWNLRHDKIFRNQVSFRVGPLDTVALDIYPTHLMISIIIDRSIARDAKCTPFEVCSAVREAIEAGIKQITSTINYVNANHSLTFHCKCNSDHPAVLDFVGGTPHNMYCNKRNKTYPLPKGHEIWQISHKEKSSRQDQSGSAKSSSVPDPGNLYEISPAVQPQHGQTERLTEDHHAVLLKQLTKHSADWRMIGLYLGFSSGELDNIEGRPFLQQCAPTSWLSAMLAQWLQWAPGDRRGSTSFATLNGLKAALNGAFLGATAHDLGV
jgi:GTPase SAR1 family protein